MRNAIFTFSLAIIAAIFASGCKKTCAGENVCDKVACTLDIRSVSVSIRNSDSSLVGLDSTVSTDHLGKIIAKGKFNDEGKYPVAGDDPTHKYLNEIEPVMFKGYKSGALIVEARFIITWDCCHVSKVSGPTEIFVQ